VIRMDKSNVKVSWQVTGIRHDAYAEAHPMKVEVAKPEGECNTLTNQPTAGSFTWFRGTP
jgi:hypothetical protein